MTVLSYYLHSGGNQVQKLSGEEAHTGTYVSCFDEQMFLKTKWMLLCELNFVLLQKKK